uniref:GAG-pre-integrase domain-containing protein n=1 Tax=Nicotiana tabacum TaxID=4097 RepID=A0A1S4C4L9_TOBAC|nr:PREDICTED: uncharacterized protein LOC107815021 [Nicotiana tabacum]
MRDGYDFNCHDVDKCVITHNKRYLSSATLINGLFVFDSIPKPLPPKELNNVELPSKRKRSSELSETYLWHLRLGHINLNRISRLVKDGPLSSLKVEALPTFILPQSSGSHVEQTAQQEEVVDIPVDSMETQVPDDVVVQPQNQRDVVATDVVRSRSGREIRQPVRYTLLGESYDRILEEPTSKPVNYEQALHDKDVDK